MHATITAVCQALCSYLINVKTFGVIKAARLTSIWFGHEVSPQPLCGLGEYTWIVCALARVGNEKSRRMKLLGHVCDTVGARVCLQECVESVSKLVTYSGPPGTPQWICLPQDRSFLQQLGISTYCTEFRAFSISLAPLLPYQPN
jgi:hypothetical protein